MAKVVIILEDETKDGEDGLSVDVRFDDDVDDANPTIAEAWAVHLVSIITEQAGRVDYIDEDGKEQSDLSKKPTKSDEELH